MVIPIKLWRDSVRQNRGAYFALLAILLLLVVYLITGPKPWLAGVSAELEAGGSPRPKHYAVSGLWAAAWINTFLVVAVAIAGPLLFRPLPPGMPAPPLTTDRRRERLYLLAGLAAAVALCGAIQAPRLSKSLWGDEEYTAKRFVAGYYRRDAEGKMELKQPEWWWTLWDFRRGPTNHQLFSALSRISHSFHQPTDDPKAVYFSETLIRLPSFLASLGTVAAVGWLAALLGSWRAGIMAGFILALHPWFIRYGPEARGYGLMLLMLTLALAFQYKAVIGGRWRDWLAFGLAEFLCFISFLGSLHFIVLFNLSGLLLVVFAQSRGDARWPQFGRFVVANILAAALVIIMLAPTIEPTREWLKRTSDAVAFGAPPDLPWVVDVLCESASGLPWHSWDPDNPLCVHLSAMPPMLTIPMLSIAAVLCLLGAVRLWQRTTSTRLLLPGLLLPAPLMVVHAQLAGSFLFPWYLLVALPVVVVLLALGIDWLSRLGTSPLQRRSISSAVFAIFLGLLLFLTGGRVHQLRSLSVEPNYESLALTREVINPADPAIDEKVITVSFSMWSQAYDPAARAISTSAEMQAALADAKSSGRQLYVNFGQYLLAKQNLPELILMIEDESLFEQVAVINGLWQPCTRWVYRAKLEP